MLPLFLQNLWLYNYVLVFSWYFARQFVLASSHWITASRVPYQYSRYVEEYEALELLNDAPLLYVRNLLENTTVCFKWFTLINFYNYFFSEIWVFFTKNPSCWHVFISRAVAFKATMMSHVRHPDRTFIFIYYPYKW